jgi:CheY-like chemotaxis protein
MMREGKIKSQESQDRDLKSRILVVEDDGIITTRLRNMLTGLGYDVSGGVASGKRAIQQAIETRPDLVLMDIDLVGEMDGIEAAGQINARFELPVIYLTAFAEDALLQRAKITEPFGYLLKPFESRELYATIEMALYKHQFDFY